MKNLSLLVVLLFSLLSLSCTTEITNPTNNESGKLILKIDKQNAPASVVFVKAYLTRENHEPIIGSLNLLSDSTAELLLDEVDAGIWHLKVDAENDSSLLLYTGETDVEVFAGFTSQVYLTLQPTGAGTGSIYIHVTWGVPVNNNWIDYQYNPLLSSSNQFFDEFGVAQPQIVISDGIYRMYYVGVAAAASKYVLYAESNDGLNWYKPISNPILYPGNYGTWDSWAVHPGAVFKDDDGIYKMYYCGFADQYSQWHIGLATSSDGINWEKRSQPILNGTSGWEYQIGASSIIKKDGVYYLYYYGRSLPNYSIAVATSSDGINFTKHTSNPILTNQQAWELNGVLYPSVISQTNGLKMVYMNSNGSGFGIATSSDGLNWIKSNNNPFFTNQNTANSWAVEKIAYPFWLKLPNETRIYYSGISNYSDDLKIGMVRKSGNY
jgi:predicted GH43/DUF377 family glycosyl hydrolase